MKLSPAQIQQFKIDGYLILKGALSKAQRTRLNELTEQHSTLRQEPFELETDVAYPGAPASTSSQGGATIRRLLHAYHRDPQFREIAHLETITNGVQRILGAKELWLNPNHHNCVMTKQPAFSSETLWHRDTRYWNFSDKYLINAWFALGDEKLENGAMKILPGSHRWEVQDDALDKDQFLELDHPFNQERLETMRLVELSAGDALLFSAHCFHAAGKNQTNKPKYSLVFTYHGENTAPTSERSSQHAEIKVLG